MSCSLFGDEEPSAERNFVEPALTASVRGSVAVSGAAPGVFRKSSARTALPSLNGVSYSVVASGGGRTYKEDVDAENLSFSFGELSVGEGGTEYTITATGKSGGVAVLFGKVTETLRPGDAFFCEVPVKPDMKSGTGSVSLEIDVSETEIKSCAIELDGDSVSSCQVDSDEKILFEKTLDSGCYDAVFSFYSTADSSSADGVLLYEFRESLHVCKSLVTDSWFGSSSYIADGKCVITKALVEKFALSRIYVSSRKEDSKETGTRAEPYKSIARAMGALMDSGTDYMILVDGTLEGAQEIPSAITTAKARSITIQGANGLDAGGMPKDSLNGKNEGTTLKISSSVPVTIKNLKITGGNAEKGGGIYNKKKLTLLSGCVVTGNTAEYGAGIYNDDGLILNGASIESNASTTYGGGIYNKKELTLSTGCVVSGNIATYGGGVYNESKLILNGATIESNKALSSGGGIYNSPTAKAYVYGSTNIKSNKGTGTNNKGGAVFNTNSNSSAASIYLGYNEKGEKVAWSGEISGNTADTGNAIYSAAGTTIKFDSGTIKNNTTTSNEGIFLMGTGTLEISGSAKIDSTNPVYFWPYGSENTYPTFKVTGSLSAESVATFMMKSDSWKRKQTILTAGDGVTLTKEIADKFSFTEDGWELIVASDGKSAYMDSPIYVAGSEGRKVCTVAGDDTNGNGSKSKPYATIDKATLLVKNVNIDYTILIDGTLSSGQQIQATSFTAASLTIKGTSTSAKIDGGGIAPALTIEKQSLPITILSLNLSNGKTDKGGGIHIPNTGTKLTLGDGTVDNIVVLIDNTGTEGGGIYNAGILIIKDHVWVRNNNETFTNSNADAAGGGIYNTGTLTMEGGQICKNESGVSGGTRGDGGGVFNEGTFYFKGGRIYNNIAWNRGGGIYNNGGTVFMSGSALLGSVEVNNVEITSAATGEINRSNLACSSGGGIYSAGESGVYVGYTDKDTADPDFTGGICFNYAKNDGGGIYGTSADVTIKIAEGSISYNGAGGNGGGIYNQKTLEITNGTFKGNSAAGGYGGGIYNISEMTLQGGTISGNTATGRSAVGAGVFTGKSGSVFTMTGGEITGNKLVNNNTSTASYTSGGGGVGMGTYSSGSTTPSAGSFKMTGGKIHGNSVEKTDDAFSGQTVGGSGVYVVKKNTASFSIGADAYIYDDDVYLEDGRTITILSNLTKHTTSDMLTITPASYSVGTAVIENNSYLAANYSKFAVSDAAWGISSSGVLAQYVTSSNIAASLSSLSANSKSSPHNLVVYATSKADFETINTALRANSDKYVSITLVCPGLTELPELKNDNGTGAFYKCTTIVEVTLPEGFTTIGRCAFNGCENLSTLNLPSTLKSTTYRDINGCSSLTSLTLPEGLESIGSQSLAHSGITSITIPENVYFVDYDAFCQTNPTLQSIIVVSENQYYKDIDGVLYNKSGTLLSCCPAAKTGELVIQDEVTKIGSYSCYCGKITSLTIPSSVTQIGSNAFRYCSQLATITFTGTKAQWNAITKGSDWRSSTAATKVTCSDGEVDF